ncbi:hypothetical protein M9458_057686 [Cirrhinus mrigala]|uniref:SRCR domain-containing protein n=1 Tax=Cirrhinus mrigala TaxID=683832 RepID=A0ABD0MEI1_CIRMR
MYLLWCLLFLHVSAQHDRRKQPAKEGSVRLVGDLDSSGRVEVYHDGQWGSVCDDGWDLAEAEVVCRQMGFPGAISAISGGTYGEGSGPIWLDDMKCEGSESSLSDCSFNGWAVTDCTHKEDAGVVCEAELNLTNKSKNLSVNVSQICHPYVSAFLRYFYTRQIEVSITSAQCLHQLAFIFGVKKLMEDVGKVFTLLIPQDNTFRTQVSMYEYAVRTGDFVLQENVLQYLSWNGEFLISSPVWSSVSFHMMDALLQRSDLIVKDEALLLKALERWIQDKGDEINSEQQTGLLNHIRFLLIPVDELYEIQFSSSALQKNHEKLYLTGLLKGFQFNALPFSKIRNKMGNMSNEYLPRIYTRDEWSIFINVTTFKHPNLGQNNRLQTFSTPAHTSTFYREQKVQWRAQVFLTAHECSNNGISCRSFPVARFLADGNQNRYKSSIRFSNRLILGCKNENNVFHVQDFKTDIAVIPANSSMALPNPCPDNYSFRFVVRPEFI